MVDEKEDKKLYKQSRGAEAKTKNKTLTSRLDNLPETKEIVEFREGLLSGYFYYKQSQPEDPGTVFNSLITQLGHQDVPVRYANSNTGIIKDNLPIIGFFNSYTITIQQNSHGTVCEVTARSPFKEKLEKILTSVIYC